MAGNATTTNTTTSNTPFAAESRWDIASGLLSGAVGIFTGFAGDNAAYKAQKANAKALKQQAGIYGSMADSSLRSASMYADQAKMNAKLGQANARKLRIAAANIDQYEQMALHRSRLEARQRVGEGRTRFAANGVMVDTGAAALWEQDEAADAALERLDIMQQFEDQSWKYRTQANMALAEGYAAAAGNAGASMGAAGDAYSYRLQEAAALAESRKKAKKKHGGIGAVIGGVAGAVIGTFCGGNTAAGFMIGSGLGGAVGNAV